MISVLVLTRNEENDLPDCLQSVTWSDDVHVFDSCSTDRTCAIAEQKGATVTHRPFDNFAAQRNAALRGLAFRHPWVLILDADERIPTALRDEMLDFVRHAPAEASACRMRRRDYLYGTWLKHAQLTPWYIRLVRPEKTRYEREVNEVLRVDGGVVDLKQPFDHYPFSKGMRHWLDKHNVYSSMEAEQALRTRRGEVPFSLRKALFAREFSVRRHHQKELFYRLPFRPLVKFIAIYVLRRGFLDGRAGLTYALLQSFYEYMIVLKARELALRDDAGQARPAATPKRGFSA